MTFQILTTNITVVFRHNQDTIKVVILLSPTLHNKVIRAIHLNQAIHLNLDIHHRPVTRLSQDLHRNQGFNPHILLKAKDS